MNALQKRLAQIGTEPHENGLCDGIVFEDTEDQYYWIYNHLLRMAQALYDALCRT